MTKSSEHQAEMERRALRRAGRSEQSLPAQREVRYPRTTTDVSRTSKAAAKRRRKALRRLNESARKLG